ncbi:hypothetical protein QFZ79_001699 [Arthrobacter sp. V4I6]|uniref:hypothetical protein n=1 Tax=unclassified Arthrobacter TaxID=235627 RepID=UPI00277DC282|nr:MULTISPECIES: hypothetical protein [unclassified Arthrobacter]MDQ0819404.1 hypothetical protein [Arthrobacter sp. V1I7]MDQ0853588.1 hypothetical protein [Arthrobacter sp. V4I6]
MDKERELIIAKLDADADRLQGLSLEDLGYVPDPKDLSVEDLAGLDSETMEWMAGVSGEDRQRSLTRGRLLAGTIWHASVLLIDQLFQDIHTLHDKESITREDIDETWILSALPPQYAEQYNGLFAQRFLVVAADMVIKLVAGWTSPSCVAQELAVRCLLDQIEITADTYDLDFDPHWRGILTDRILEDTDSDVLYDRSLDGFQHDEVLNQQLRLAPMALEHWFEPFNDERHVSPYAH